MRHFRKIRWLITVMLFMSITLSAQTKGSTALNEGVLRIKIKPQLTNALSKAKVKAGTLRVGHSQFDIACQSVKAYQMERVFPFNEKFEEKYKKHGLDLWYEIRFDNAISPFDALTHYKAIGDVELVEPSYAVKPIMTQSPSVVLTATELFNDPFLAKQWHYSNTGESAPSVKGADINLFNAWNITKGNPNVIVSIVDGGIDINHDDLKDNLWINEAELYGTPGEDSDGNGFIDDIYGANFIDLNGKVTAHDHGTHVAGTVAASNNNGIGVAGVAGGSGNKDGVKLMSCQLFDSKGMSGNFARAIVYGADNGAVISQNSWGYMSPEIYEQVVLDAIDYFIAEAGQYPGSPMKGGVVIFAAGNDGSIYRYYPGAYEPVVCVSAMGPDYKLTSYSNYGDWVDITAPGGESLYGSPWGVLSTYPDNRYSYMDGTSMACPHVSGIAALVVSKYASSTFTNSELKQRLLTAVNNIEQYNPNYVGLMGYGYIDALLALSENNLKAPQMVTDLVVEGIAQDFASLKWSAVPDEDDGKANRYEVYYSKNKFDNSSTSLATVYKVSKRDIEPGEKIEAVLENLEPLTEYYFAVRAYDRWNNASELSEVLSARTNEGPKFVITASSTSIAVDVTEQPEINVPFSIRNDAPGFLKWEASLRHVGQNYSTYSLSSIKPEITTSAVKSGVVKKERTMSATSGNIKMENSLVEQQILRYGDSNYYVIGDSEAAYDHMAATMFVVPDGFNLTDIYVFVKHNVEKGPMKLEIMSGNVFSKDAVVFSQEFTSTSASAYEHRIKLDEQVYIPKGAFWINIISPKGNKYPFGIATEYEIESSSYCFLSIDGGRTFTTIEDAMRGGFEYPETVVWDIAAVSNNRDFGEYLKLTPASGSLSGNEEDVLYLTGNGAELIEGSYNSNLVFKTNDPEALEVKHPISFTVSGQKPKLVSEKIINFNDVFVGTKKSFSVEVVNEGLAPFFIESTTSSNPAFRITNWNSMISAHGSVNVEVQFTPIVEGSQSSTITMVDNNGTEYKFSVYGIGCVEGQMIFEPETVDLGVLSADMVEDRSVTFTIKNSGKYPLEYSFLNYAPILEGNLANLEEYFDINNYGYAVVHNINGENTDIIWQDHANNVLDITEKYTSINRIVPVDLGFSFPLYDQQYDSLYISDCAVLLSKGDIAIGNCVPPMTSPTCWGDAAVVSACGYPLKFTRNTKIAYSKSSGKLIVTFENVGIESYEFIGGIMDLQMVVYENGNVDVIYRNLSYEISSNFFEVLLALGDEGCNDPFIVNDHARQLNTDGDRNTVDYIENMAFRIINPGTILVKDISEPTGMLQIGEEKEITMNLRLENLPQGNVMQNINILTSNTQQPMTHLKVTADVTTGGNGALHINPAESLDLGSVLRTASLAGTVQISNRGTAPLTINSVSSVKGNVAFDDVKDLTIKPSSTYLLDFVCKTNELGTYDDDIIVVEGENSNKVAVQYVVLPEPKLVIDRVSIDTIMDAGVKAYAPFVFGNDGDGELDLRLEGTNMIYPSLDNNDQAGITYIYKRSDEDENVIYNWVDHRSESTHVQLEYFVDNSLNYFGVILPFKFKYYETEYDTLWVHRNGFASFDSFPIEDNEYEIIPPQYIGINDKYNNFIAPMWGYHNMSIKTDPKETGIFVYKNENSVTIEWATYTDAFGICPPYDFQLILDRSGNIKMQYRITSIPSWTTYAIGLENKDASDAIVISNGKQVLEKSVAIDIIPAQSVKIASKEKKVIDFAIDASTLYADQYNQQVKIISNDPAANAPDALQFSVMLNGEPQIDIPSQVSFGHILSSYMPATKSFVVSNPGTANLMIDNVTALQEMPVMIEVLEVITSPWGTFEDYFPVEDVLPITVKPGEDKVFRIVWMSTEPATLTGELEFTTSLGKQIVALSGDMVNPPVFEASHTRLDMRTKNNGEIKDTAIVISNKDGESELTYQASIEYIRNLEKASSVRSSMSAKTNAEATQLSTMKPASVIKDVRSQSIGFNRTLDYLEPEQTPNNFLGFGKDFNFVASTAFNAPEDGFKLSHVQTWYRPGELQISTVYAYILVGDANPGNCDIIGQGRITVENSESDNVGGYITVELDDVTVIYPGELFHVMFSYPLGASNPQGHSNVLLNKVIEDRYFYADGLDWYDISLTKAYFDVVYLMRALEYQGGSDFWLTAKDALTGTVKAGEETEFNLTFNSNYLIDEEHHANLRILTNDPTNSSVTIPVTYSENTAPVVTVGTMDGIMRMSENEQKTFALNVADKEGDTYHLSLDNSTPEFVTLHENEGVYTLAVDADYNAAGSYVVSVLAEDMWGKVGVNALKLEILNVNRAPVYTTIAAIEMGVDEFSGEIDLDNYFSDPDNDMLKYSFVNESPELVKVFLTDNVLLIKSVQMGGATIKLKATDPWGDSVEQSLAVNVVSSTGINRVEDSDIIVLPNPVVTSATISWGASFAAEVNYSVYTTAGSKIMSGTLVNNSAIDFQHCEAGIYYLRLEDDVNHKTIKIIKN